MFTFVYLTTGFDVTGHVLAINNLNQTTAEIAVLLHNQNLFIMSGIL